MAEVIMKRTVLAAVIFFAAVAPLYLWWSDVQNDRRHNLTIVFETELFKLPPQDYPKENTLIGKVDSLSEVDVLRMGYGKDFRAWKVKTESGLEGWLIEDGKNVKINKK